MRFRFVFLALFLTLAVSREASCLCLSVDLPLAVELIFVLFSSTLCYSGRQNSRIVSTESYNMASAGNYGLR